jgi:hypothetical protein
MAPSVDNTRAILRAKAHIPACIPAVEILQPNEPVQLLEGRILSLLVIGRHRTESECECISPSRRPSQQGNKVVGTGAVGLTQQSYSVSLSPDGNTAIVGGRDDNSDVGAAWISRRGLTNVGDLGGEVTQQFGRGQNYPNPFATTKVELL